MVSFADLLSEYAHAMWVDTYYKIAILMFIFYLIFLLTDNPTIVDFGYCSAHLAVGINLFIFYSDFDSSTSKIAKLIILGLLTLWYLRLGGFILFTRVLKGHKDGRYE